MSRTDTTRRCELCGREVGTEYYLYHIGWLCAEHYQKSAKSFVPTQALKSLVEENNQDQRVAKLEARVKELETALARVIQELKEEIVYSASLEGPATVSRQARRDAEVAERFAELDKLKSGSKDKE